MKTCHIHLFIFLVATCFLTQGYASQSAALLTSTESDPDSFVTHCVNVITGDYCESTTDLVIIAPDLLVLQRYYNSKNYITGDAGGGWRIYPQAFLVLGSDPQGESCIIDEERFEKSYAFTGERSGGILTYTGWRKSDGTAESPFAVDVWENNIGMVNTYCKEIGGQTNHRNQFLYYGEETCEIVLGDGSIRYYKKVNSLPSQFFGDELIPYLCEKVVSPKCYRLIQESLPSGNQLFYFYDSLTS